MVLLNHSYFHELPGNAVATISHRDFIHGSEKKEELCDTTLQPQQAMAVNIVTDKISPAFFYFEW